MAPSTRPETGHLGGRLPYVRIGDGPKTLLVIPGLDDAMFDGTYGRLQARLLRRTYRRFLDEYTVYVVSRPRGLDHGTSIRELAADYARVLERQLAPASVLGTSMGGLIAQELARDRPDLLERVVLAVSGCRLAEERVRHGRRLRWYALEEEWNRIRTELYRATFTGLRHRVYPALASTLGRLSPPNPAEPQDVVVSIDAVLEYDSRDHLGEIEPRTLVIGGDEDPFFPERILRETHEGLPDSQLAMFTGARHGAAVERKAGFDNWTLRFLEGQGVRVSQ